MQITTEQLLAIIGEQTVKLMHAQREIDALRAQLQANAPTPAPTETP